MPWNICNRFNIFYPRHRGLNALFSKGCLIRLWILMEFLWFSSVLDRGENLWPVSWGRLAFMKNWLHHSNVSHQTNVWTSVDPILYSNIKALSKDMNMYLWHLQSALPFLLLPLLPGPCFLNLQLRENKLDKD